MTVFDVFVNDRRRCRAGVGADGVLSAIVSWVRLTGPAARTARRFKRPLEELRLHIGGLRAATHRSWVEQPLRVGDRVTIAIGKARSADRPLDRKPVAAPRRRSLEQTSFLNVDLDIVSKAPLESLIAALGRPVLVLYAGPEGRRQVAHLEAAISSDDPNRLIRRFVDLVRNLPRAEKRLWDTAEKREFNLGFQAAAAPATFESHLDAATVRAAASVHAGIGITIYGRS